MKAYRIFYREKNWNHPQEVVWGEAALARRLARKRPVAIHHELAMLWKCDICRKRGPWEAGWRMIPRKTSKGERADFSNQAVVCSRDCAEVHAPGYVKPHWMDDGREPIPHQRNRAWEKLLKARWAAFGDERERKSKSRDHRKVPMPKHKGGGFCRWCNEPVPPPRQTWHKECYRTYLQHTDAFAQAIFLRKRDGDLCPVDGCAKKGAEVDHTVPLWSVAHLPDEERLFYFSPANLKLLCIDHHREKTAREAGERARLKADTSPAIQNINRENSDE